MFVGSYTPAKRPARRQARASGLPSAARSLYARGSTHKLRVVTRAAVVVNEFLIPGGIIVGGKFLDSRINWGNAFWFNFIPVMPRTVNGTGHMR